VATTRTGDAVLYLPSIHRFGPIFELLGKDIYDSYQSISLELP